MIDHSGVTVPNIAASKAFYRAALAPLGYAMLAEFEQFAGFGIAPKHDFWIGLGVPNVPPIHIAFRAESRREVDAFHRAALAAGGRDNGAPGLRPQYPKACLGDSGGEIVEIQRVTATPGQQNHRRPAPLGDHIDAHILIRNDFSRAFGLGCRSTQHQQADRNAGENYVAHPEH